MLLPRPLLLLRQLRQLPAQPLLPRRERLWLRLAALPQRVGQLLARQLAALP